MERPFIVIYLIGVCIAGVIRITQSRKHLRPQKPQIPPSDLWLMFLWFLASHVLPMLYGFRPILTFADYPLPRFLASLGVGILGIALWLLRQSHLDLDRNWSPIAQIHPDQHLMTQGVYHYVRHPMYSAHLLWGIAQGLLISNWLVGWSGLLTFALFCCVRIPQEETMMKAHFGSAYVDYQQRVGAIAPKLLSLYSSNS